MPGRTGGKVEVAAWLRDLGLERYAAAFLDAEITPDLWPALEDLFGANGPCSGC